MDENGRMAWLIFAGLSFLAVASNCVNPKIGLRDWASILQASVFFGVLFPLVFGVPSQISGIGRGWSWLFRFLGFLFTSSAIVFGGGVGILTLK